MLFFALAAGLVLLIPGCSVLIWLPARKNNLIASLADGVALSISINTLLALWFSIVGLRASPGLVVVLYSIASAVLLAGFFKRRAEFKSPALLEKLGWLFLAAGLIAAMAAWRLYQARELALPAWVDSVHHALVIRKILDYRGIPPDLSPYIPTPFYYHFGFHLIAALFTFWIRQPVSTAMLWFGQVISALASLAVFRAGYAFGAPRQNAGTHFPAFWNVPVITGFAAALLSCFVFQMPAYYVTWGRYTMLTGLILLGPFLSAVWEIWQEPGGLAQGVRLALLTAGLCATHYFVLLLAGLFFGLMGLVCVYQVLRRRSPARAVLLRLVGWSGLGFALALPWVWRVAQATLPGAQLQVLNPLDQRAAAVGSAASYLKYLLDLIGPRRNIILLALAGAGLLAALFQPAKRPLAIWGALLAILSLPWGLRFYPFRPDHFAIVLFFPAAILLANLMISGIEALARLIQPGALESSWFRPMLLVTFMAILLTWGIRETTDVLNTATILVTRADLPALDWVEKNTPAKARFFINSVFWQGNAYRGVDGGYWLEPYTGRYSLVPPALYADAPTEFTEQVNRWADESTRLQGCDTTFWRIVKEAELSYVYLRQGTGALQPASLVGCQGVQLVYQGQGVFIFALHPSQ